MVYKWYILPIGGLYATYHPLGEPETTTETTGLVGHSLVEAVSLPSFPEVSDDFGHSWKHRGMIKICMWPCRHGAVSVSSEGRKMMAVLLTAEMLAVESND